MKVIEIRKLSTQDLTKQSSDLREEIADLKRRVRMGEVQNVRLVRTKRKDLARMLTILSEQLLKETYGQPAIASNSASNGAFAGTTGSERKKA